MKKQFFILMTASIIIHSFNCRPVENGPTSSVPKEYYDRINTNYGFFESMGIRNIKGWMITEYQYQNCRAKAYFFDTSYKKSIYKGDVSVNDNPIDTLNFGNGVVYQQPNNNNYKPFSNLKFDGSLHYWQVEGLQKSEGFTASVQSPCGGIRLNYPRLNDTISRYQDLKVEWSSSGDDTVTVTLYDWNFKNIIKITTGSSVIFWAPEIYNLTVGRAVVVVEKSKYSAQNFNNQNYIIISRAIDGSAFFLK
jgi:hypothetical protein